MDFQSCPTPKILKGLNLMKTCSKCKELKPLSDFTKRTQSPDGRTSRCRVCINEKARERSLLPKTPMPSREVLNDIFEYRDGVLYWKKTKRSDLIGKPVGSDKGNGYLQLMVLNHSDSVHRVIWAMFNDDVPEEIDHIDLNKKNNKIENLRAATQLQNCFNKKGRNCSSGVKNVRWVSKLNKWIVRIGWKRKTIHIGLFDDIEEAKKAAFEARNKYHGEFANHD